MIPKLLTAAGTAALLASSGALLRLAKDALAKGEALKDALLDGSEVLAKGIYRGVTGVLVKPIEGAQKSGVEGFVAGMGKGLLGVVTQPTSGVLDLVSIAAEGASNAKRRW